MNRNISIYTKVILFVFLNVLSFSLILTNNSFAQQLSFPNVIDKYSEIPQDMLNKYQLLDSYFFDKLFEMRNNGDLANPSISLEKYGDDLFQVVDDQVRVEVGVKDVNQVIKDNLINRGFKLLYEIKKFNRYDGWLPIRNLDNFISIKDITFIRAIEKPYVNQVISEGDAFHRAYDVRTYLGYNGNGRKVGIISNGVDHRANSISAGELPSNLQVINNRYGGDEGTAMLEIAYDLSPGTNLAFADYGSSESDFANNINLLWQAGCQIICDDIIYFHEPAFEDGIIAQQVNTVSNNGGIYVSSAGNQREAHYIGDFVDDGNNWNRFELSGGYSNYLTITVQPNSSFNIVLQWNEKYGLSGGDYDLYLYDDNFNYLTKSSTTQNGNDDPYEIISRTNSSSTATTYHIAVLNYNGSAPIRKLRLWFYGNLDLESAAQKHQSSSFGHNSALGCMSVAAIDYGSSQRYYSSEGPAIIYSYNSSGDPVTYNQRIKPDISALDGVHTYVGQLGYFNNPFYGTSAAAPHVAAIAALVWSSDLSKSGSFIRNLLETTAVNLPNVGSSKNNQFGEGRVDALNATISLHPTPFTISGYIRDGNNNGISGVIVTFTNGGTATSNSSGYYSKDLPYGYTGIATPSLTGWSFNPISYSYDNLTSSQTNKNYTATHDPVSISGYIRDGNNSGINGVTVTFSSGGGTATSNSSGYYSRSVPYEYSGTATPSLADWTFSPTSYSYNNITTDQSNKNYTGTHTALNVSGYVKDGNNIGINGVTITFSNGGGTATTNSSGYYSRSVSYGYTGTATASLSGWSFTPTSYSYNNITSNQTNKNYTGTHDPVSVSGYVRDESNNGINGVTITFSNGGGTTTTNSSGYYNRSVPYGYSGTASPGLTNWSFNPPSITYNNIIADQPNQNYVGSPTALTISGYVRDGSSNGISGVSVSFTNGGGTATTISSGYYSISIPSGYTGTATPSLTNWTFVPLNIIYANIQSDQTNQNYTGTQNNQNPVVSITYPTNGQEFTNPDINVQGTASDPARSLIQVEVKLNGGSWVVADGSANWFLPVTLEAGDNTICARAKDDQGAYSDEVCVSVSYNALPENWTNLNPVPNGNNLKSVSFIDDLTGWMVGAGGFITKTTNAGEEWKKQVSNTGNMLRSVCFSDEFYGWAVGDNGTVLHTTDGGNNWAAQNSSVSSDLNSVRFINQSTGWAVGYEGTIIKTSDGGTTWLNQVSGVTDALFDIDFYNTSYLIAVGGNPSGFGDPSIILKTTNGGTSWINKNDPPSVGGLLYGVEITNSSVVQVCGESFAIMKSTDAGETWNVTVQEKTNKEKTRKLLSDGNGGYRDIYFRDSNNGYAVGGENTYFRRIAVTTDGGNSWTIKSSGIEENDLFSVSVTGNGKGFAVGLGGLMFITSDGGSSWSQILSGSGYAAGDDIYSLDFTDSNNGWASGTRWDYIMEGGVINKSINGGKIFSTNNYYANSGEPLLDIFFVDNNHGWAISNQSVLRTTDNGVNWSYEFNSISNNDQNSIFFLDQNKGWITSGSGMYKTTDGGISWTQMNSFTSYSTFFINQDTGYVLTSAGLYKTTDAGLNWVQKNQNTGSSVFFSSNDIGWFTGVDGHLYKTTNGGETWNLKNTGVSETLKEVQFCDVNNGLAAGNNGTLIHTTDGGESWLAVNTGTSKTFYAVHFENPGNGWAAGEDGLLLKYTDPGFILPEIITSVTSIPDFGEVLASQVSSPQSYTVQGTSLTNNIVVTAPEGFQLSLNSGSSYTSTLTLTQNGGVIPTTTIYVRFEPAAVQTYSGNISHTSSGASTKYVAVSGTGISSGCQPNWEYTSSTGSNATIAVPLSVNPQLCEGGLQSGDVIGIFFTRNDSLICGGYTVWSGTQNISITAWGDNAQTTIKDGFAEGELIRYKIWDNGNCMEYVADVTYSQGTGNYMTNGIYVVSSLSAICTISQVIELNDGWNMISSYLGPEEPDMDSVAYQIWPNLVLFKNGHGEVYWPDYGINQIGEWYPYDGYQVYMTLADSLVIYGLPVQGGVPLEIGWNLIAYLRDCAIPIEEALADIVDNMTLIKDGLGNVYWPEYGINQIGSMRQGQGYQVYMTGEDTLYYPDCPVMLAGKYEGKTGANEKFMRKSILEHYSGLKKNTGGNATLLVNSTIFGEGDEIGVYNSTDILVGNGIVNNGKALVTICSDDEMTEQTDGAKADEELYLDLWKKADRKEVKLKLSGLTEAISGRALLNGLKYQTNGIYETEAEEEVQIPTSCVLEQNYPNPFNPSTVIRYGIPADGRVVLEIYDVIGQRVGILVNKEQKAGYYEISYRNPGLSSGVYFYRLQAGDFVSVKKMVMMK